MGAGEGKKERNFGRSGVVQRRGSGAGGNRMVQNQQTPNTQHPTPTHNTNTHNNTLQKWIGQNWLAKNGLAKIGLAKVGFNPKFRVFFPLPQFSFFLSFSCGSFHGISVFF